jgi:hypothetical protein
VLRRIARASVEQLAGFLAAPRTAAIAPEPPSSGTETSRTLLSRLDDFSPEAAGIFRVFSNKAPDTAPQGSATVPLPPDRPAPGAAALAYTDPGE